MNQDPYIHVPELRQRIIDPEDSDVRMSAETMAAFDALARANGLGENWRWSDNRLDDTFNAFVASHPEGEPLWIFAYGSLMWNPAVHFDQVRHARAQGFRRMFAFRLHFARGSEEHPALMLTLEPAQGCCDGLVFRFAPEAIDSEARLVWRREMIQGHYRPQWHGISTPQGEVRALVFTANVDHPMHVGELPIGEAADMIAKARGAIGSNAEYLHRLAEQLEAFDIDDTYVRALDIRVRAQHTD